MSALSGVSAIRLNVFGLRAPIPSSLTDAVAGKVDKTGGTGSGMSGDLYMSGHSVKELTSPVADGDAVNLATLNAVSAGKANVTDMTTALAGKASTALAMTTAPGLMSAADKVIVNSAASTAIATTTANGLMTAASVVKLNGIATGATANSSDAFLLARANQTGFQAIGTVTGLQSSLDGKADGTATTTALAGKASAADLTTEVTRATGIEGGLNTRIGALETTIVTKTSLATVVQTQGRPGDVLDRFASTLAGSAANAAPVTGQAIATSSNGSVLSVTGAQVVGTRERISTDPLASLRFRWAAIRVTDPTDPSGATLRFGLQFLTQNKTDNGQHFVRDMTLHVADGRQTQTFTIAAANGAGVDFVWPANTCYVVPYVQTFDVDGVTDFQVLSWEDVTDILALQASGNESVGAEEARAIAAENALGVQISTETTARIAADSGISNRTAVLESEIVRGEGEGITIEDSAGYMLASIDPVAIHHPQMDAIAAIATRVGARVTSQAGGGFAVQDGRGNMLFEVTADAINHPVIQQLMVALTLTKQVGAGFSITDPLGNMLIEVTPAAINHPMMAALSAAVAVTKTIGDGFSVVDPAGNTLIHVGPTKIDHPQINQMATDLAPLAGATRRIGDGFAVEDSAAFRLLSVTPTDIKHPAISFLRASVRGIRDPQWNDIQAVAQLIGVQIYGQSLSRGQSALPMQSVDPIPGAFRFNGGIRPDDGGGSSAANHASLVPAFETTGQGLSETPVGGALRMLLQLLHDEDGLDPATMGQALLGSADGQNSQSAAQLSSGSAYFQRLKDAVTYGYADAPATFAPGFLGWVQGEQDYGLNTDPSTYKSEVLQILSDYTTFAQTVTGVTRRLPMLTYQTATHIRQGAASPTIAIAQLQLAQENALVGLATPAYPVQNNPFDLHLSGVGSMHLGAFFGLAAKRWLWDGIKPVPFVPLVERSGKSIIAHFPVAVGRSLQLFNWGTPANGGVNNYGATIVDNSGTNIPVTGVTLIGRDKAAITTASAIPANAHLRLGWIGNNNKGLTGFHDDEPLTFDPTGWALPMYRWAPICDLTVS